MGGGGLTACTTGSRAGLAGGGVAGESGPMSHHPTSFQGDILQAIRDHVLAAIPDAKVEAAGGGGHFTIHVTSPVFAGKSMLQQHQLVLKAVAPLMRGDDAPLHAVDSLVTRAG